MSIAALPTLDVFGRGDRLRASLGSLGCDALVVTHLTNIRYLSGFTGSAAVLVVEERGLLLVTDGRYEEQAATQMKACGVHADLAVGRTLEAQRAAVTGHLANVARVGLEAEHVSWSAQRRYADEWFATATLVATSDAVETLRAIKDPGEVARIEAACSIADASLAAVLPRLDDGLTEAQFALALDDEMRRHGADDVSFSTIVAAGANGSCPHHMPGAHRIKLGDLVVIDFGALVEGYHSDMTRTIPVGGADALDDTRRRMLSVVTAAQAAAVAAVRPGAAARDVDAACREVIAEAGWAEAFVHGAGHGVGLDIHEAPSVWATSTATLAPGHVVTVEPGVYLPGLGGVRVEDTVVVTEDGCRPLTSAPKPIS